MVTSGRRELLDVALVARQPARSAGHRLPHCTRARHDGAERRQRIVVNLAAGHDGRSLVEQAGERAQDAALGLAAQAEQDEIVARQHRVDDLRDDRVVVADDAGEERAAGAEARDEVLAHFVAHRTPLDAAGVDRRAEFSESRRSCGSHRASYQVASHQSIQSNGQSGLEASSNSKPSSTPGVGICFGSLGLRFGAWDLTLDPPLASPILPRPLVYAHRGGAALRPENTLAAFDHGLALGADGLELDVHLSRDGVGGRAPRPTLERTTDGSGRAPADDGGGAGRGRCGYRFPVAAPRRPSAEGGVPDFPSAAGLRRADAARRCWRATRSRSSSS